MKRIPMGWVAMGLGGILLILTAIIGLTVFRLFKERTLINEYQSFITKADIQPVNLMHWLDQNIGAVSSDKAGEMVLKLEQMQQAKLSEWQATFERGIVQTALFEVYRQNGWTLANLGGIQDAEAKAIVTEAIRNGYKVETAEGMFFPVVDYTVYQKYQDRLSPDLVEYLEIMAVESEQMPAKDAALVIGWDEVLKRARRQEAFLKEYPSSAQAGAVRQLLKRYVMFALFGSNNTPLFSYETGEINGKAKIAFHQETWRTEDGRFSTLLSQYLKVLEENNYRLTAAVNEYRQNVADTL